MADEKKTTADIDDWLDDLDDSDELSDELDQDNIDALLSGGGDSAEGSGEQAASGDDEGPAELDQANIDALFGEISSDSGAGEVDESLELDQANIDALLDGGDDEPGQGEEKQAEESSELDQSDIDLLLGDDEENGSEAGDTEQRNIDALLGGGSPPVVDMGDGLDVDQDEIDQLFAGLDDDEEVDDPFESEDMDLADVLESDEEFMELRTNKEPSVGDGPHRGVDSDATVATVHSDSGMGETVARPERKGGLFPFFPEAINKAVAGVIAACLVLFAGVGLYFFRSSGPELPPAIVEPVAQAPESAAEAPQARNFIPVATEGHYQMPVGGGEVAVVLTARDDDNDPLTFQIASQPQHGRLSGEGAALTYLPNKEFSGEDRFEFVANDGKDSSCPADIVITGPNLAQLAAEEKKKEGKAGKKNQGTAKKVVKVAKKKTLKKAATTKRVAKQTRPADLPPEIRLSGLAASYQVGETVLVDVSQTRDEERSNVSFTWEQLSGTPVLIEHVNDEGSIISFSTPSSFYSVPDPGPVLRVTAVDETGKRAVKNIKIRSVSRRRTALWHGEDSSGAGRSGDSPLYGRALP
ncbi:MAG: Ig-like domain-containing protein [Pseudomonadota bacterium]